MTPRTRRTQLVTAAAAVALVGVVGGASAAASAETARTATFKLQLPAPTGTRPIGTTTLYLIDRSRRDPLTPTVAQRRLVVQLWYPAANRGGSRAAYMSPRIAALLETAFQLPSGTFSFPTHAGTGTPIASGRHPLLLLSHGLGTLREFQTALAGDLASRGYIVASIAHTYDAAAVELVDGRVIEGTAPVQPTESQRALLLRTRVGDVRFVLGELLQRSRARAGLLAGRIATAKVGALGHSLGGATAAAAMLADPRIRSGVDLDGTIFGAVAASGLGRPFMLMVGDHFSGGLAPDQAQFFRRLRSTRYALTLAGAGHYSFTDLPLFAAALAGLDQAFDIGTIDPLRAHTATSAYVAAFFDGTLRGRRTPLLDGASAAYPEVRFITAERKPTVLAHRSGAAAADATPVGPLPRARVTTILTHPGSLVAVALPRAATSTGLVWRLARRLDASIVPQLSEADVGTTVVAVFRARRLGRAEIVFALTRGDSSPKALRAVKYVVHVRPTQR